MLQIKCIQNILVFTNCILYYIVLTSLYTFFFKTHDKLEMKFKVYLSFILLKKF